MAKTAPLAEISLKYVDSDMYLERLLLNFTDLPEFPSSATVWNFRSTWHQGSKGGFSFSGICTIKIMALSSIKLSPEIQESVCSVVKYFYNSPHVFYCNPRWKTFVWPKMGCVWAKKGLWFVPSGKLFQALKYSNFFIQIILKSCTEQSLFCTRC